MKKAPLLLGSLLCLFLLYDGCPTGSSDESEPEEPALSGDKAITAFSFPALSVTATIDEGNHTVAATVPHGTSVTGLVAAFTHTGQTVQVGAVVQTSGVTANDFSSPVTYTVVAEDSSTQDYMVTVTVAASSAKELTSFGFPALSVTGTIDEGAHTVAATVPYGTNVTALVAAFTSTGQAVKVGSLVQTSGVTANDFSSPVTYTVVAADSSTQDYVVTVTVALSSAKELTSFGFPALSVTGTINEGGHTVAATVPYGTNVTALVAAFTHTGQAVKVGSVVQTSGVTANDFTSPVTYTVVAPDSSTQDYAVTVTPEPAPGILIGVNGPIAIPPGTGSVDLGFVYSEQTSTVYLYVYNTGPAGSFLRLTGATESGADTDSFQVTNFPTDPIPGGNNYEVFGLTFTPGSGTRRLHTMSLSITSNAPADNPYTFAVTGDMFYRVHDTHGTTGTGTGQFKSPAGVAFSPINSCVYVTDQTRDKVLVFDASCNFQFEFGPASGNGCLAGPVAVAVDSAGYVYVGSYNMKLDAGFRYVQKYTMNGVWVTGWGLNGSGDGQFSVASGIAISADNEVYVSDANRIQVFSTSGTYLRRWAVSHPWGILYSDAGDILVCTGAGSPILAFETDGTSLGTFNGYGGLFVAQDPDALFSPTGSSVRVIDPAGVYQGEIRYSGLVARDLVGVARTGGYLYFVNCDNGNPAYYGENLLIRAKKKLP